MTIQDLAQVFIKVKLKTIRLILKDIVHLKIGTRISCKGEFYKVNRMAIFSPLKYLDNATQERL